MVSPNISPHSPKLLFEVRTTSFLPCGDQLKEHGCTYRIKGEITDFLVSIEGKPPTSEVLKTRGNLFMRKTHAGSSPNRDSSATRGV